MRCSSGMRDGGRRQQDVHRHARGQRPDRRQAEAGRRVPRRRQREAVPLIVGRRAVLPVQVVGVDRPVAERNLVVVGVVERLGEGVRRAHAQTLRQPPLDAREQGVVVRAHARFEVDDAVGSADDRVEDDADVTPDDEVRPERVDAVQPHAPLVAHLVLDAQVELLRLRVLHRVVDDVDPRRAGARQDEAGERVGDARRKRRQALRPEEEHVAGAHFDRQRAAVEAALERLNLERDAVEVDAVAAVEAALAVGRGPVEADTRPEVVQVPAAFAFQERLHDWVDLVVAGDVLDVGVQLVPQPEIEREVRAHPPVVLDEEGRVRAVGIGDHEVLIGLAAAERHRKQQVVVVHLAVAVGVEGREVLDQLHAPGPEHAQPDARIHPLHLAAGAKRVRAKRVAEGVGELPAALHRVLRHPERRAVFHARERVLRAGRQRDGGVVEVAQADAEAVHALRREHARPRPQQRVVLVGRLLTLRRRGDRPVAAAAGDVLGVLPRVAEQHMVVGACLPVDARQAHDVVERRGRERPADDACGRVARAHLDRAVLVAVLHGAEAEQVAFPQRPADRAGDLLAIKRRRIQAAVGRDRRGLHGVVAEEQRRGAVQRVAARAGDDVDGRAGRASKVRGKPAGGDLELLHALLDDVEQRPAHHVVVVVHAVDGDVAAAAELPGRRDDHGVGLGRIEVRRRGVAGDQQRQLHEVAAVERQPVDGRAR